MEPKLNENINQTSPKAPVLQIFAPITPSSTESKMPFFYVSFLPLESIHHFRLLNQPCYCVLKPNHFKYTTIGMSKTFFF